MKNSRKNVKTIRYCGTAAVLAGILMLSPLAAAGAEPVPEQSAAEVTDAAGAAESSDTAGTEALPDQAAAQQTPETSESSAAEIRVHLASEPGDPVPYKTMDLDTASLLKQISEGLVVLDENGEPAPGSAKEWKVSGDGLQWTFTLRDGLSWSDGSPMKAKSFVRLFRLIADSSTEALYGQDLTQNIAGYAEVMRGDPRSLKVSAPDDSTLVIELTSPDPDFARICASWSLLPLRELTEGDEDDRDVDDWTKVTGNGPYMIESVVPGQEYVLKKNPYYRGGKPDEGQLAAWLNSGNGAGDAAERYETVHWIVSGDENAEYSDFLNQEIDAVASIPPEEKPAFMAESSLQPFYRQQNIPDILGIGFNCKNKALSDPRVRRALSTAVDRTYIAEEILDRMYLPLDSISSFLQSEQETEQNGQESEDENQKVLADSAEALRLLEEAGHKNGEGIPELVCIADENGGALLTAQYLASVWKTFGIKVRVETADADDLAEEKSAGTYDIFCSSIYLPSDLPSAEFARLLTDSEDNVYGFSSEEYDALPGLGSGSSTNSSDKNDKDKDDKNKDNKDDSEDAKDLAEQQAEYEKTILEAVRILDSEMPLVPLASRNVSWLRNETAAGITCDSNGCWQLIQAPASRELQVTPAQAMDSIEEEEPAETKRSVKDLLQALVNKIFRRNRSAETDEAEASTGADGASAAIETAAADQLNGGELLSVSEGKTATIDRPRFIGGSTEKEEKDTILTRLRKSNRYFENTDQTAYLTKQAWILDKPGKKAEKLRSLPKYSEIHQTGTGNQNYVRIEQDGTFRYIEADKVTSDPAVLDALRAQEKEDTAHRELLAGSMHFVKESELSERAADVRAETERILEEIAHREMLRTQTRNPNWDGPVLSRGKGSVNGPSGKETYYNLNMNGVVNVMRRMGNNDEYWVRDDGCKMLGDYIMCAANLSVHPRGSLVESSLGTCIVCDTGGFASRNANQIDIAVTW